MAGLNVKLTNEDGRLRRLSELEAEIIQKVVARSTSMTDAALNLGIARSTLYRKLTEYDIKVELP